MEKDLAQGIRKLGRALNSNKVDYMFIGGVAISFYGTPRASVNMPPGIEYDVDVWYMATNHNFTRLIRAISEISPELESDLSKMIFDPKKTFIKFRVDQFHFDFLPELVAFQHKDFAKCYLNKEEGIIEGTKINIISKNDLILDKQKLGRDKDLADIENLKSKSYKGFSR
ncbi:MAG: hypothetical protein RIC30_00035 [Marinoscillum sp.]|uniref:hypothetical protein n=1 Tax=Marinoscillum sp. TaxID=2024838 RepID=UPI003304D636